MLFFFSSRRRHTRFDCDWSSDVCSSDLSASAAVTGGISLSGSGPSTGCQQENRCSAVSPVDRKSTRLNSSHSQISYAVFCLKKKKNINAVTPWNIGRTRVYERYEVQFAR